MEASGISSSELRIEAATEECSDLGNVSSASGSTRVDLSKRKILFHPARKPLNGFTGCGVGDFKIETLNPGSDPKRVTGVRSGQVGATGLKVDSSDVLENGLDPVLSLRATFRKIGAGLENLGNTCFLNSVLQCLTYTEPLVAYLQSGKHQNSCHIAGFCALCAIQKHVSRALQSTGRILAPNDLVSNLRCISRNFRNSRQEDAHEYMVNLLESMHKCCLPSGVPSESPRAYERSLVHKIFGGRLRSQVKCWQCSYCSDTFDPFLDLSLEIVKADTLPKALKNFTAAELLDGGERQYQCQRCKQKVKATKQLTVYNSPHVLTIHLKRFQAHNLGQKIDRKVEFGSTIDMKPFVSGSNEGHLKYTLYGVLVHRGWSTHSGHYYCFVRTSSGMWYSLDDNRVLQVSERTVLEQKAYMLFYVRDRKDTAPRNPVDILQRYKIKANVNGKSIVNQNPKEHVQTGPIQNKLSALDTSAAMPQKETINGALSKETIKKEVSSKQNTVQLMKEGLVIKKESILPSSNVPLLKVSSQASASNLIHGENLQPSAGSVVGNFVSSNIENSTVTTGAKDGDCKESGNCKREFGVGVMISPNCGGVQKSSTDKMANKETLQEINLASNIGVLNIVASEDSIDKAVKKAPGGAPSTTDEASKDVNAIRSPKRRHCESNKIGDVSYHNSNESLSEKGDDNCQKIVTKSPSSMPYGSLETEAPQFAPCRRSKKHLKRQLKDMSFGLKSKFFLASLLMHSKKKRKRNKESTLNENILYKGTSLDKDCYSSNLEPSTSEKSSTIMLGSIHGRKKATDDGIPKSGNNLGISLLNTVDGAFKERIYENGTVLSTDQHIGRSPGPVSEAIWHNSRETDSLKHNNAPQHRHVLSQGLRETVVPKWDDTGSDTPMQTVERNGMSSLGIGYVPDEWDEEYDRGKRKKIRQNKHQFGGPNLFQQIATRKTQLKKAKLDHSDSGNQPFRI
ncbi:Ubiquitin carboxyl-terminal hydrolase 23 [Hibiscus syriacus]|uniref:Ubiquitin carboxyl-terminal hydrolase n=1 Tax=Hibiscus syriacus TaxID=106335 RepID=A0A6A2YTK6_HIBSY|nr:ubiquitin carboxyl-terminal hydrolase 23 [Hibiscus syriacus]KAE8682677.1 Ubiquitin carboxyl-terminal hydrolase 23 [Hibiscus syriacus]